MHRRAHALERALFASQRRAIHALGFREDAYGRAYRVSLKAPALARSLGALLRCVRQADLVLVGDHRTFGPSRDVFLQLIERVSDGHRPVAVALAGVEARHQATVDRFLRGACEAGALRRRLFDDSLEGQLRWEAVAPVLAWARAGSLRVVACGASPKMGKMGELAWPRQDALCARMLTDAWAQAPEARLFVLVGQERLAPSHLPAALARATAAMARSPRIVSVLQNCSATGEPGPRVHAWSDTRHCLVTASPVEVQQSHLDALELGPGDALLSDRPADAFRYLAEEIGAALGVPVGAALERLRIYTPGEAGPLVARSAWSPRERREVRRSVLARESAYFPAARVVYLAGSLLNHAAEEAAHFVRHCAIGRALLRPRRGFQAFYARCLEEALAFFASRRINPARPCVQPSEWAAFLRPGEPLAEAAAFVLAHRAAEGAGVTATLGFLPPDRPALFHAVTHGLGYLLGEALDTAVSTRGVTIREAQTLFRDPLENPASTYFHWARRLSAGAGRVQAAA